MAEAVSRGAVAILGDLPNHDIVARGEYFSRLFGVDVSGLIAAGGGEKESNRRWLEYYEALMAVAGETGCELAIFGRVLDARPPRETFGPDATHPSAEGHRLIAEALTPVIARVFASRSDQADTARL